MKVYNKLVRDEIPAIIKTNGEKPVTRVLNDTDYVAELIKKLGEEYGEFKEALSIEELADIQEVILALADVLASREELEAVRSKKAAQRGAFTRKIFLEATE